MAKKGLFNNELPSYFKKTTNQLYVLFNMTFSGLLRNVFSIKNILKNPSHIFFQFFNSFTSYTSVFDLSGVYFDEKTKEEALQIWFFPMAQPVTDIALGHH